MKHIKQKKINNNVQYNFIMLGLLIYLNHTNRIYYETDLCETCIICLYFNYVLMFSLYGVKCTLCNLL